MIEETIRFGQIEAVTGIQEVEVIRISAQGIPIPGERGPSGVASFGTFTSSAVLSGHRVLTTDGSGKTIYASSDNSEHVKGPFIISMQAVVVNEEFDPIAVGLIIEPSWTWTPRSLIYLGPNGTLTDVAPTSLDAEFLLVVGTALTPTQLFFDPQSPIRL